MKMSNTYDISRHIKNELTGEKGDIYTNGSGCEFTFFDGKCNYKIMVLVDQEANARMEMEEEYEYVKMCMEDPKMMEKHYQEIEEGVYCKFF